MTRASNGQRPDTERVAGSGANGAHPDAPPRVSQTGLPVEPSTIQPPESFRGEQRAGVGVLGLLEDALGGPLLHHFAVAHQDQVGGHRARYFQAALLSAMYNSDTNALPS